MHTSDEEIDVVGDVELTHDPLDGSTSYSSSSQQIGRFGAIGENKNINIDVDIQRWINVMDNEAKRRYKGVQAAADAVVSASSSASYAARDDPMLSEDKRAGLKAIKSRKIGTCTTAYKDQCNAFRSPSEELSILSSGLDDAWKRAVSTQNQPAQLSLEVSRQRHNCCTREEANCEETEAILKPLDLSLPRNIQVQRKSFTRSILRNYLLDNPAMNSTAPRVTTIISAAFKRTAVTGGVTSNTSTGSAPVRAIIVTATPFKSHGHTGITTSQQIPPAFKGTAVTEGVTIPSTGSSTTMGIQSKSSMQDLCANKSFMVPLCSPAPGVFTGVRPWKTLPAPSTPEDRVIFEDICKGSFSTTPCVTNDGDKARHRTGYIWISANKRAWYCDGCNKKKPLAFNK
ncbi:hypothetical protein QAD02_002502 [Eretmocerus hayati]|uniref:Uncharacterized protein n=1 Tax=Eretmocerus hayati TaxID=131215 RepID=A0ACC2NJ75_9HYME|nr:hypothetical protein QAD02_002502 [Eretmocerus hayati]